MTTEQQVTKPPIRLKAQYQSEIRKQLMDELKLGNVNEVPKLEKIVLNIGLGKAKDDKKAMEVATTTLKKITGQTPVQTLAKISVAGFKLREGNKIGLKVTLRGDKMYEFLDRLINIVLPRLRDFHGLSLKSFDKQGNYSVGIADQTVFPEINFEDSPMTHGLQAVIVINSTNKEHCRLLLEKLGMPFEKELDNVKGKEN
jgi:large subunit ribosomal protein L5